MNEIIGAALFNFYSFYKVLHSLRKGNTVFLKSPLGKDTISFFTRILLFTPNNAFIFPIRQIIDRCRPTNIIVFAKTVAIKFVVRTI